MTSYFSMSILLEEFLANHDNSQFPCVITLNLASTLDILSSMDPTQFASKDCQPITPIDSEREGNEGPYSLAMSLRQHPLKLVNPMSVSVLRDGKNGSGNEEYSNMLSIAF